MTESRSDVGTPELIKGSVSGSTVVTRAFGNKRNISVMFSHRMTVPLRWVVVRLHSFERWDCLYATHSRKTILV